MGHGKGLHNRRSEGVYRKTAGLKFQKRSAQTAWSRSRRENVDGSGGEELSAMVSRCT